MALVKRHWKMAAVNLVLLIAAIGTGLWMIERKPAHADVPQQTAAPGGTAAPTLDLQTYARLRQLRQSLALADSDLAAMGCTQTQATQIFSSLASWYQSNKSAWDQAEQTCRQAQSDLQATWRQINLGPKNDAILAQLPAKQQASDAAKSQFQQLLQSAAAPVSALLTTAQSDMWTTARANISAPERYRYATALTASQITAIRLAISKGQSIPDAAISVSQQSAIDAANASRAQSLDGVVAAERSVLPSPAAL